MLRWIIRIIPLIFLLLLTGSCGCKQSGSGSTTKYKHDPQQADQADSAIAELTQKMADLQAELKELKKEKTPDNQKNVPSLNEDNAGAGCCKAWQRSVEEFAEILLKQKEAIEGLTKQLTQANITATQAKRDLELAKQEFVRMQQEVNVPKTNVAKESVEKAVEAARVAEKGLKEVIKQFQEAVRNSPKAAEESPIYQELQDFYNKSQKQATELSKKWEKTEEELKKTVEAAKFAEQKFQEAIKKAAEEYTIYKNLQELNAKVQEQAVRFSKKGATNKKVDTHEATLVTYDAMFRSMEGELKQIQEVLDRLAKDNLNSIADQLKILEYKVKELEEKIKNPVKKKGFFS
jgi:DNA repair exonuclease SbcCD ATPase subunit